ncbi:MAG TPA: aldo/keto reductase [Thermoleophilaceae bacterium]|jgi:aryl-alcohol dehydrogenase-like predicted oxidoreductase
MRQRNFGTTDLTASEIAFGTWALGSTWWGETDDADRLIGRALELGVTFFDTGNVYGQGKNEEMVGRALAGADRDSIQISTKFGYVLDSGRQEHSEGERPHDWSPAHVRESLEGSLRRLGTDYVDLYQLHNPRMDAIENDELFAVLDALRDEGKIRHYGIALGPAIGWRDEGVLALERRGIAALQTVYNLLEQDPGADFLAAAERSGAGIMARVPTSSGLLEDKYTLDTEFGPGDHRRHRPRQWLVDGLQKIDRLRFLVIEGERSMTQAALKFILARPQMACVIPTIGTLAELEEFAAAADAPDLTDDELARVQELYVRNFDVEPAAA